MMWAVLLLIAVVIGVHWFEYTSDVQEYTLSQPLRGEELQSVLREKTPVIVEIGSLPWRPEVMEKAAWSVVVEEDGPAIPASEWVASTGKPVLNGTDLAEQMDFSVGLADLNQARRWWWLSGMRGVTVDILQSGEVSGFSWVGAERKWIGCTHGGPLILWLVHSRYRKYLPDVGTTAEPIDPWSLTVEKAPWIGRVQFIEVRIKPGWCIGLPAHWGVAVKNESEKDPAWWWSADQHSVLSSLYCNTVGKAPAHTES